MLLHRWFTQASPRLTRGFSFHRQAERQHSAVLAAAGPHCPADGTAERQGSRPRRHAAGKLQREERRPNVSPRRRLALIGQRSGAAVVPSHPQSSVSNVALRRTGILGDHQWQRPLLVLFKSDTSCPSGLGVYAASFLLANIGHDLHCYADDVRLYVSNSSVTSTTFTTVSFVYRHVVKLSLEFLKLNSDHSDFVTVVIGPKSLTYYSCSCCPLAPWN